MRSLTYNRLDDVSRSVQGGLAAPVEMLRGTKTHSLLFRVTADVTIAGGAGGAVKEEGLQKLLTSLQLQENGKPVIDLDGWMLGYLTAKHSYQTANIGSLANANAQANTILRADFVLPFADLFGADPGETCFVEQDSRFPTKIRLGFTTDPQTALITGAGLTLNSLNIECVQVHDPNSRVMPFFIPRVRRTTSNNITGSPQGFRIPVVPESGNRVSHIVAHATSDGVTSDAMLTGLVTFRGDAATSRFIDAVNFRTVLAEYRRFFPQPVVRAGYLPFIFRQYGKLSEMLLANQADNWRIEADMTGPGTTNVVDVFTFESAAFPGYTRDLPSGW